MKKWILMAVVMVSATGIEAAPIQTLPGLVAIRFLEVSGTASTFSFNPNDARRTTRLAGKRCSMAAMGTPAAIETTSVSLGSALSMAGKSRSNTWGLVARTTTSAHAAASRLSVDVRMP